MEDSADMNFVRPSEVVVIHPGSRNLRIGLASDPIPRTIPHCVARRLKKPRKTTAQQYLPMASSAPEVLRYTNEKAIQLGTVLSNCVTSQGVVRSTAKNGKPITVGPVKLELNEDYFKPSENQENVFGNDALHLVPDSTFIIQWPMKKGRLNVHRGTGGSLSSVLHDLHDIWTWAIKDLIGSDPRNLNAILIIDDVYVGEHIKRTIDMMFNEMGFKKLFVHLEGVCSVYGAGIPSACVVDVGESKVLVTCVEDGISLKQTRVLMEFGGGDVTQLVRHLLKTHTPLKHLDQNKLYDARFIERIKQSFCHLDLDHCGTVEGEVIYSPPGVAPVEIPLSVGDDAMKAVLGLFAPEILSLTGPKGSHLYAQQAADPQDPHDDFYILQTQRKRGDAEFDDAEDEDGMPTDLKDPIRQETIPVSQVLGIDVVILQSVDRCDSDEVKRKMLSNILIVGGGLANFKGVASWLKNRLAMQLPQPFKGDPVEITTQPKDLPADNCAWRGAALMTQLDTSQELWISSKEWLRFGSKMLRERAVFGW